MVTYHTHEHRLKAFHFHCLRTILAAWQNHVLNTTDDGRQSQRMTLKCTHYCVTPVYAVRVCHIEDSRLQKEILCGELANAPRPRGCPKLHYKDVLHRDLLVLDTPDNWEVPTNNPTLWCSTLNHRKTSSITTIVKAKSCERMMKHIG